MHLVALLMICLAKGVFGSDTCNAIVSLEQVQGLSTWFFATPWGAENLENFCEYLEGLYDSVSEINRNWFLEPYPLFAYFKKSRFLLEELCTVNEPLHQEYKKHEACYLKLRNDYYDCYLQAVSLKRDYFEVPPKWPKNDTYVNECIKEIELFFCVADRIQETCDDPEAIAFYLYIARWTDIPSIYCHTCTVLADVQLAVKRRSRDLLVQKMRRSKGKL